MAAALLVLLIGAGIAAPSSADEIAEKRAEAARLAAALDDKGTELSALAEEYNEARLRAEQTAGQVQAVKGLVRQTDDLVRQARARVKGHAVDAYLRGGPTSMAQVLDSDSVDEVAVRQIYVRTVLGNERAAIDALHEARELRDARQAQLEAAQDAARSVLAAVGDRRQAAAAAVAAQEATLARVRGDLSGLVEAESRRRADENARRAQAELARRAPAGGRAPARAAAAPRGGGLLLGPVSGASRPPAAGAAAAVAEAKRQIGKPYQWGAAGPNSFDCSGLTLWAWRAGGRSLPHSSRAQYAATSRVALADIQPGDLTFYGSPIHHMGIYVGGGQMVEASQTGTPVRYASIYRRDLVGVGRVG